MPTDDPTDPQDDPPRRRRVTSTQLLDALEALPGRVAAAVRGSDDGGDDNRDTGDLPPTVTFEPEPEPEPDAPPVDDAPPPAPLPALAGETHRRSGFPRRRR